MRGLRMSRTGPVALIRPCRPPSPAKREKWFINADRMEPRILRAEQKNGRYGRNGRERSRRPPSPAVRVKRFGAFTACWSGSGLENVRVVPRVVGMCKLGPVALIRPCRAFASRLVGLNGSDLGLWPCQHAAGNANVGHMHGPGVVSRARGGKANLGGHKRDRGRGTHGNSQGQTKIGIEPGREVERQDGLAAGVHGLNHQPDRPLDCAA